MITTPLMLFALIVLQFIPVGVDSDQQAQLKAADQAQQETLQKQCERGNESRPAQIDLALDIAKGNAARARAWKGLLGSALPPSILIFAQAQVMANEDEHDRLVDDANVIADAQLDVSVHPQAQDPRKRAVVDCAAQFG